MRGVETAEVVAWPGQTPGTTQKVVLTALGGSVATPPDGLTAEVVVVDDWAELHALPPGAVKGKILLFNHKFDKQLAAQGGGLNAYGGGVVYRGAGPSREPRWAPLPCWCARLAAPTTACRIPA